MVAAAAVVNEAKVEAECEFCLGFAAAVVGLGTLGVGSLPSSLFDSLSSRFASAINLGPYGEELVKSPASLADLLATILIDPRAKGYFFCCESCSG